MIDGRCQICGANDKAILAIQTFEDKYLSLIDASYNNTKRSLVACRKCGMVYRNPQLDEQDLLALYGKFRDSAILGETPDEYFDRITGLPKEQSENYDKVAWLDSVMGDYCREGTKRILDIGCGGGVFLYEFRKWYPKWKLFGVEPTTAFAELAGRRLESDVRNEMYRSGLFATRFHMISLLQVLEHVLDPISFMKEVHQDLEDGGKVYVEVPDISDFEKLPLDHDRFHAQHVSIFSYETLSHVLRRSGFCIQHQRIVRTVRGKRNISVVAQRIEGSESQVIYPLYDYKKLLEATTRWRQS